MYFLSPRQLLVYRPGYGLQNYAGRGRSSVVENSVLFIRAHAYTQVHTLEDIMTVEQLRVYFKPQPLGGSVPPPIKCNQPLSWAQE